MSQSLNIIVSAYGCVPDGPNEHGTAWTQVCLLARTHRIWVLTSSVNRPAIEGRLSSDPIPNATFIYFDLPLLRVPERGPSTVVLHSLWQWRAYTRVRQLHRRVGFDLAWHCNGAGDRMASFLWLLPIPLVWGPLAPADPAHSAITGKGAVVRRVRSAVNALRLRHPLVRLTARRSALALGLTADAEVRLRALGAGRTGSFVPAAMSNEQLEDLASIPLPAPGRFGVITFDSHETAAATELAMRAFALFRVLHPESEQIVVAEPGRHASLRRAALELAISDGCRILTRPNDQILREWITGAHVLLQPVFRDANGRDYLRAMGAGRPSICLDVGLAGSMVPDDAGVRVPHGSDEQSTRELAAALYRLASDASALDSLSASARDTIARRHCWEQMETEMTRLCRSVIHDRAARHASPVGKQAVPGANR